MPLADVGAAIDALPALGVSDDLVDDLRKFFDSSAGDVEGVAPDQVVASAFGSAPASVQCSSDAQKARTHVADALLDMGAALRGYGDVVHELHRDVTHVDEVAQQQLARQAAAADACVAPSFAAPSSCTLPTHPTTGG